MAGLNTALATKPIDKLNSIDGVELEQQQELL